MVALRQSSIALYACKQGLTPTGTRTKSPDPFDSLDSEEPLTDIEAAWAHLASRMAGRNLKALPMLRS